MVYSNGFWDKNDIFDCDIQVLQQELPKLLGVPFVYALKLCQPCVHDWVETSGKDKICLKCGVSRFKEKKTVINNDKVVEGGRNKMEKENDQVDLAQINKGDLGEIELPKFDISKYLGKKVKIDRITEHSGQHGYFIKVLTEMLDRFEDGKELRASRIFGLQKDVEGKIGWGVDTKLGVYLKKMNCKHYKDLIGKEVMTQSKTNKDGKDYLDFN